MPPELTDFFLSSNIPHRECDILHWLDSLDIKTDCWDCRNILVQLQFVQYCGLSSCIQAEHEYSGTTFVSKKCIKGS